MIYTHKPLPVQIAALIKSSFQLQRRGLLHSCRIREVRHHNFATCEASVITELDVKLASILLKEIP